MMNLGLLAGRSEQLYLQDAGGLAERLETELPKQEVDFIVGMTVGIDKLLAKDAIVSSMLIMQVAPAIAALYGTMRRIAVQGLTAEGKRSEEIRPIAARALKTMDDVARLAQLPTAPKSEGDDEDDEDLAQALAEALA